MKPIELVIQHIAQGGDCYELKIDPMALADYLDAEAERRTKFEADVLARLGKLESLNPEVRDVVGTTASGATVHGLRPTVPLCSDGRPVHDMQGQTVCPDCGYEPKVARIGDLVESGGPGQQIELKGGK